jgi:hypothetical protein
VLLFCNELRMQNAGRAYRMGSYRICSEAAVRPRYIFEFSIIPVEGPFG